MANRSSPTIRLRELGARLRELRNERGMTVEQVAAELMVSAPKISRLETGARGVNPRDIRDLGLLYQLSAEEIDHLLRLAKESKQDTWWQKYELPYATYVGLEQAATVIADYESGVIPGLLQTEAYARAVVAGGPSDDAEADQREVEARLKRQSILTGELPPRFQVVMDEAAIRRMVGGADVMKQQLAALIDAAQAGRVIIQVIPFEAGAHPGLDSTFTILSFDQDVPDVVYVAGLMGNFYLQNPGDLDRYRKVFQHLQEVALSPADTLSKITAISELLSAPAPPRARHRGRTKSEHV